MKEVARRELEIMFARQTQPIWFRIAKWVAYIGLAAYLHRRGSRGFWAGAIGLPLAGVGAHLLYRWKTGGWTRSWGRWQYDGGGHAQYR